jgi:hypothetical protein
MIWWYQDPKRSKYEREQLAVLTGEAPWLVERGWKIDAGFHLIWEADIVIEDEIIGISLRYPNHFPSSPPVVASRDPSQHLSSHQYASGELCLEFGADNWRSELTGADMIRSAHLLLSTERSRVGVSAVVPSRHETTLGQDLRSAYSRVLLSRELETELAALEESEVRSAQAVMYFHEESVVIIVVSINRPSGDAWRENLPAEVSSKHSFASVVVRFPANIDLPTTETLSGFRKTLEEHGVMGFDGSCVLIAQGSELHAYRMWESSQKVYKVSIIPAQPQMPRLDADHTKLVALKVGIVGGGSLGSKVAASLARAGVGGFVIVDHDILLPDNFVRHDLDFRDAGRHKADAVAARIQLINPSATCSKHKSHLGGQESGITTETLIEALGECDLLVDATAEASSFNYLSNVVLIAQKPMVWAEVFAGGIGGTIARHRPGCEPEPQAMRDAIDNWWREQGVKAVQPAGRYQGGENAPAIADDADVAVIAAHATRLAIDTLLAREPSMFPYAVYVVGLSAGLIFKQPFEVYPIDVGTVSSSGRPEVDPTEQKEEVDQLITLIEGYRNADSSGTAGGETPS